MKLKENISSSNKKDKCPECGGDLVKRNGKYGSFLACSNYLNCKYSQNIN